MIGNEIRYMFNDVLIIATIFDKLRMVMPGSPYPRDMYLVRHRSGTSDIIDPTDIIDIIDPDL